MAGAVRAFLDQSPRQETAYSVEAAMRAAAPGYALIAAALLQTRDSFQQARLHQMNLHLNNLVATGNVTGITQALTAVQNACAQAVAISEQQGGVRETQQQTALREIDAMRQRADREFNAMGRYLTDDDRTRRKYDEEQLKAAQIRHDAKAELFWQGRLARDEETAFGTAATRADNQGQHGDATRLRTDRDAARARAETVARWQRERKEAFLKDPLVDLPPEKGLTDVPPGEHLQPLSTGTTKPKANANVRTGP